MSHSETQEITGNHITREQQLQNMRLATQKYLQPENQVNTQSILPENTGHTEQPVYNGSSENMRRKLHSSMHLFQRRIKYQKTGQTSCPGTAVEKYTTGNTEICANRSGTFPCRREATNNPFYFKKYRFRTGR